MSKLPVDHYLLRSLEQRKESHTFRKLSLDRAGVDFFSNDYLGIAAQGLPKDFSEPDLRVTGHGATGSRLLSGNFTAVESLESFAAQFHQTESALVFNSGYDANLGLLASIASKETTVLSDELCHASILDGIRLSRATVKLRFKHNDLSDLENKLKQGTGSSSIIVAESVYSMDGDWAPLTGLADLAERYHAMLVIDEAHATGVWGNHGQGLVQQMNLEKRVYARVHTFGKAMGGHGAVVVGNQLLKDFLINFARSFIYTTALPPASIEFARRVYEYFNSSSFSNQALHSLISHFIRKREQSRLPGWIKNNSPIQSLVIGDPLKAKLTAAAAVQNGLQVNAIVHPSVAVGTERLRICLHAYNTTHEIDQLMDILEANA